MLILISDAFDPGLPQLLEKFGEVTDDNNRMPEADVILVRSKTKVNREYIDEAKKLKLVIRGGVGIDNIDSEYAASKGIKVHNTPKASSIAVAEVAMTLMLSMSNNLVMGHNGLLEGKWLKKECTRRELYGKTLALIGMGNIAVETAKRAKAFGMNTVAYRKSGNMSEYADVKQSIEEAVQDADYISLHLPLTDETREIINAELIASMKSDAIIINTGRGNTVDAEAMSKALVEGKIGGYATDVWPSDPPPSDYPLLEAPNCLFLPHIGANSPENLLRIGQEVLDIISENQKEGLFS
jgi:D-3-phosphoglycerate dehydrogenase